MQTHKIRHWRPKSFHHWLLGMVFLSCIAGAGSAGAQPRALTIDDGPENTDGEYTVTATLYWSCDFTEIFLCHENSIALYERANGGDWHLIAKNEPSDRPDWPDEPITELSVTLKRDNGTYDYRVHSEIYWWRYSSFGSIIWEISDSETSVPKTIIVNKPGKPSKPRNLRVTDRTDQYDNSYKVKWDAPTSGDYDYYLVQERKNQGNWCLNQKGSIHGHCYAQKGSLTSYTATSRASGASYSYRVFACNDLECSDPLSASEVLTVNVQPPPTPDFFWSVPGAGSVLRFGENKTLRIKIENDSPGITPGSVKFYRQFRTNPEDKDSEVTEPLDQPINYENSCDCYNANWTAAPEGEVTLIAKVGNKWGKMASKSIPVTVQKNQLPVVSLPALPQTIDQYETLDLEATAVDPDGSIQWVKIVVDTEVAHFTAPPYRYSWTAENAGSHVIYAEVMDNDGSVSRSADQSVTVKALQPPSSPTQLKIDDQLAPIPDNTTGFYTVSWNPVAGADEYLLQQLQKDVDTEFEDVATPDGVTSVYLPNQSQGHYRYRVAACNAAGCGDFSGEIALSVVLSAPQAPGGLSAVPARVGYDFTGTHTLSWESVTREPKPKYYQLEEKAGGVDSPAKWQALTNNLTTELLLEDKAPGTYSYRVKACNAFDCSAEGEILTLAVQPPNLLTAAPVSEEPNCNGHCLKIQGTGIDPDSAFTLTDLQTGGRESLSSSAITWQPPVRVGAEEELDPATYAWLPLSAAMQDALDNKEGIHVSVQNANGERAGIDAYGNETVERLSQIDSAPAVGADGTIYVGSGNNVYALNPQDGAIVSGWPYATGDLVKATPTVDSVNGHIYVGSLDDHLYALNPLGLKQWHLKTGGDLIASAVLDENRILYQGSMDGVLYAVQAQSGAVQWTYPAGAGIAETPVLAGNGSLYFTTVDSSQVYALGRGILGPDQLAWESSDDSLLKEKLEELDWQPGEQHLPEYQTAARLYRLLLQPPLNLSRDVLTFWTFSLVNRASVQEVAHAFLSSDTGKVNFPSTQSNATFVDALYARAFPGQNQPVFTAAGQTFTRNSLLDAMAGGMNRAEVASLFAQSLEYTAATNELLRRSFDYFYTQDYSWAVFSCDEGDEYTRDCDADGLPDYWEILFFGDTATESGDTDADGDGLSNRDAFLANLDPCANLCYYGVTAEAPAPAEAPTLDPGQIAISSEIGSLPGDFRVNETGAASYSIPLSLPAGTAGVAPELSLNYSSQGGNGLLGHGWALGGLSAISRCRQTLGQDGQAKAITWSSEDRFCLDGQRLLVVAGEYGARDSLYRTEIDSFALIKAHGGTDGHPDYFTVERKDGSISYYGDGNRSRQRVMVGDKTRTLTWGISRFEDSALNPIEFVYAADVDRDEPNHDISHRISEIRYAYTSGGSAGAKVAFDYKGRQDPISGYLAGELLQTKKRLSGIRVQNDSGNGLQEVRRYTLEYLSDPRDNLSRLERIRQCAGPNGTLCQPDTVFDWRLPLPGSFAGGARDSVILSTQRDRAAVGARPADINGDGRMDLVWLEPDWDDDGKVHDQYFKYVLATENGFGPERTALHDSANPRNPYHWEMIDYNGDGRADLVYYAKGAAEWRLVLSQSDGNGNWYLNGSPTTLDGLVDEDIRFVDIDGDGLTDAVSASGFRPLEHNSDEPLTSSRYYHFGTERSFEWEGFPSEDVNLGVGCAVPLLGEDGVSRVRYFDPDVSGDFNGDGSVDLVLIDSQVVWKSRGRLGARLESQCVVAYRVSVEGNDNSGYKLVNRGGLQVFEQGKEDFQSKNRARDASALDRHRDLKQRVHAADINSDGLTDLILEDGLKEGLPEDNAEYRYRLSTGQGFKASVMLDTMSNKAQLQWFDYDNDGYRDLVWHQRYENSGQLKVRLWRSIAGNFGEASSFRSTSGSESELHLFIDMNSDGVTDYVRIGESGSFDIASLYLASDFREPVNVIDLITDGLGAQTKISYGSLSGSDHYARLSLGAVEQRCQQGSQEAQDWCSQFLMPDSGSFYAALNDPWSGDHRLGKLSTTLELTGPVYAVTRVDSSAPTAADPEATSGADYYYARAKLQGGGRGMLGFERIRVVEEQTGVKRTTAYRQDFPYAGRPLRIQVDSAQGRILSETQNLWQMKHWQSGWGDDARANGSAELGPLQPFLAQTVEKTYALASNGAVQGELLKTVTTSNEYDDHGNPKRIAITTHSSDGDSFATDTLNEYGEGQSFANTDRVLSSYPELGRLTKTTVKHSRSENGESDEETRISAFTYYNEGSTKTGLLETETIEPESEFQLVTRYDYDAFGNKTLAEQTITGEEPRAKETRYLNGQGRFPETETNGYGQITQKILARNDLGQPIQSADIAGLESFYQYDVFGRHVLEYDQTGAHSISLLSAADNSHCPTGSAYQQRTRQAGGAESITCHDILGRETRSATRGFDGAWVYADTEYDRLGRVARKSEPYSGSPGSARYWTVLDYDILGRVVGTDLPGTVSNNGYIGTGGMPHDVHVEYRGYTTVTTNPEGRTNTETKNAVGDLILVQDHLGGRIENRYDAQGNLRFVTRREQAGAAAIVTEMRYDKLGRKEYMNDPDKGVWEYGYNGFGELEWQIDAKRQMVVNKYDRLGRLVRRTDYRNGDIEDSEELNAAENIEGDTLWTYNNHANGEDGSPTWDRDVPPGALSGVIDIESGYAQAPGYDDFGRPGLTLTSLAEDDNHWTNTTYDQYGRVFQQFDAAGDGLSRSATQNIYNQYGYLEAVVDGENVNQASAENYYTVLAVDERGSVTRFRHGNGVVTERTYDPATGRLEFQTASILGAIQVQDLSYQWDNLGNLDNRRDRSGGKDLFEEFEYDALNRLRSAQIIGREAQTVDYDGIGNITYKSDVGHYYYADDDQCDQGAGPHAVCATSDGVTYTYDANGNMTGDSSGRSLQYSTFDKPLTITKGGHTTEFKYGPDRSRYLRIDTDTSSGEVTETRYIGDVEKIIRPDDTTEIKRYLPGGAVVTITGGERKSHYLHKDHLGSVDVITDKSGTVIQELSFDPWGQRRNAQDWTALIEADLKGFDTSLTTRGYTGHEMLDQVGLIHMNGRVYDPRLARFIQADPYIQYPDFTQSFNRYSYVFNNPLNAVDPSGYLSFSDILDIVVIVVAVVIEVVCEGCGAGWKLAQWWFSGGRELYGGIAENAFSGGSASGSGRGAVEDPIGEDDHGANTGITYEGNGWWLWILDDYRDGDKALETARKTVDRTQSAETDGKFANGGETQSYLAAQAPVTEPAPRTPEEDKGVDTGALLVDVALEVIPGGALYKCSRDGCDTLDWVGATVDLVPGIGKLGKLVKLRKLFGRGKKTIPCSFIAGTLISTAAAAVPIEEIKVGDTVLSRNEITGEVSERRVNAVFAEHHDSVISLVIRNTDGTEEAIVTTEEHPFYVPGEGWVDAGELQVGDSLKSIDGERLELAGKETLQVAQAAYNFEVDGFHTYGVGESGVWVHNVCDISKRVAKKVDTPHTQVTGGNKTAGAPKTSQPNSIHEQTRPDGSKSVTYYDEKGRMFSREDYGQQRTHGQLGRGADGRSVPHEHGVDWSDQGPIGKKYRELNSSGKPVGPWINE